VEVLAGSHRTSVSVRAGQAFQEEIGRGPVEYHSTTRRYVLNGKLDPEVREALLDLRELGLGSIARAE
jgi:hypothetical protein